MKPLTVDVGLWRISRFVVTRLADIVTVEGEVLVVSSSDVVDGVVDEEVCLGGDAVAVDWDVVDVCGAVVADLIVVVGVDDESAKNCIA